MISKEFFLKSLGNNKAVRTQDMDLLTAWFAFPGRAVTAEQVAEVTGAKRASLIVNNLGKRIASFLEIEPEGAAASILALEGTVGDEPAWIMRDELAAALIESGAVAPAETDLEYEEAEPGTLKAVLIEYDQKVVRAAYPQTPLANRLLNPEMINALVSELPANKRVYQRAISVGLRKKVSTQETNRFLQPVLKLLKENA